MATAREPGEFLTWFVDVNRNHRQQCQLGRTPINDTPMNLTSEIDGETLQCLIVLDSQINQ
jgi:hypothetical protein